MSSEPPFVEDPNVNVPGTTMEERLKKYEDQKQKYSAWREEQRINEPTTLEKIIAGIKKVYAKIAQHNATKAKSNSR